MGPHVVRTLQIQVILNLFVGPDAQGTIRCEVEQLSLTFNASELRLRGTTFINQPHTDEAGNILCWNGEVCLSNLI